MYRASSFYHLLLSVYTLTFLQRYDLGLGGTERNLLLIRRPQPRQFLLHILRSAVVVVVAVTVDTVTGHVDVDVVVVVVDVVVVTSPSFHQVFEIEQRGDGAPSLLHFLFELWTGQQRRRNSTR